MAPAEEEERKAITKSSTTEKGTLLYGTCNYRQTTFVVRIYMQERTQILFATV